MTGQRQNCTKHILTTSTNNITRYGSDAQLTSTPVIMTDETFELFRITGDRLRKKSTVDKFHHRPYRRVQHFRRLCTNYFHFQVWLAKGLGLGKDEQKFSGT